MKQGWYVEAGTSTPGILQRIRKSSPIAFCLLLVGVQFVTVANSTPLQSGSQAQVAVTATPSRNSVSTGGYIDVTVTISDAGSATWQTVHVSFPSNPSDVRVISCGVSDGCEIYRAGYTVSVGYGKGQGALNYVMVEGTQAPMDSSSTKSMVVRVYPNSVGTFNYQFKTVAKIGGILYSDPPQAGAQGSVTDQQGEQVYVRSTSVGGGQTTLGGQETSPQSATYSVIALAVVIVVVVASAVTIVARRNR